MEKLGSLGTLFPFRDTEPVIESARVVNEGEFVSVSFDVKDNITTKGGRASFEFEFNSKWLHSASPLLCGSEYYRRSPPYMSRVCIYSNATSVSIAPNGVCIAFESTGDRGTLWHFKDTYPAWFLFAYAPYVGRLRSSSPDSVTDVLKHVNSDPLAERVATYPEISIIKSLSQTAQRPYSRFPKGHKENIMDHEHLPSPITYDGQSVLANPALQLQLIKDLACGPGFVVVQNAKPPKAYDEDSISNHVYSWFFEVFGKPNQHPVRKSQVFQTTQKMDVSEKKVSQDYNLSYPLLMHTDSATYASAHSYLQVNYQTIGGVTTRLTDGFACADYIKRRYPEYYKVLTEVPVTFGMRHQLYTRDGAHSVSKAHQKSLHAKSEEDDFYELELINSRPIITEADGVRLVRGEDGKLMVEETCMTKQVTYSSSKIGVSAIKMENFDFFMEACEKWYDVIEGNEAGIRGAHYSAIDWPQDSMLIFNNHRMLHGRGTIVDAGVQEFITRPVNRSVEQLREAGEIFPAYKERKVEPPFCDGDTGLQDRPMAKEFLRQMVGAHQAIVNTENRLRLLTMKMLEKQLQEVQMECHSEFGTRKTDGIMVGLHETLALWFPRCPTKVLERMMPLPPGVEMY